MTMPRTADHPSKLFEAHGITCAIETDWDRSR